MNARIKLMALAGLTLVAGSGCAPSTPVFDRHFGESARILQAQQVRNADAPIANSDRNVDGLDGRAAKQAMDGYQRSFAEPPKQTNAFTIGVSSGDGDR